MADDSSFKALFDKGAALIKGSIQLDSQKLAHLGFFEKRRLIKARKYLEEASHIQPSNGAPMLFISKIDQRLGQYDSALEWLKKAAFVEPDNDILAIELGATLGRLEKHAEAVVVLERAVEIFPEEPRIRCNLALSYLMAGETENAVKEFERVNDLEPDVATNRKLLNLAKRVMSGEIQTPKNEAEIVKIM